MTGALLAVTASWLDLLIIALLAFAAFTGWRRGFVLEVLSYGGLLLGLILGAILAPSVAGMFPPHNDTGRALASVLTLFGVALLFQTCGFLIGSAVRRSMRHGGVAHGIDSAGGALFSGVAMLAGLWFLGLTLASGPSPGLSMAIRNSAILHAVDRVAPSPPDVLAALRRFLDTSGFPEVFSGLDPRFAPPVTPPDISGQEAFVQTAAQSTVKVLGEACGSIQQGSGWVAAPGLVVTNAHVVAGVDAPRVIDATDNYAAETVAYDPDKDLAVLRVDGLEGSPMELVPEEVERGTPGAVLGYPENEDSVTVSPAAVRGSLRAVGRDIYYDHRVEREVYVVQADIRPGNSGGPLVGTDGRVIGVVFAAAVGEASTGYALTGEEVAPVIGGAGDPVDTGRCRD